MNRVEARLRYDQQKNRARERGIEWDFSFSEWCEIWAPHWEMRGPHKNELGMCRTRDVGSYRADNVRLDTPKGNAGDRVLMRRRSWQAKSLDRECGPSIRPTSHASSFPRPDVALELSQKEYEWIPGE